MRKIATLLLVIPLGLAAGGLVAEQDGPPTRPDVLDRQRHHQGGAGR